MCFRLAGDILVTHDEKLCVGGGRRGRMFGATMFAWATAICDVVEMATRQHTIRNLFK